MSKLPQGKEKKGEKIHKGGKDHTGKFRKRNLNMILNPYELNCLKILIHEDFKLPIIIITVIILIIIVAIIRLEIFKLTRNN